MVEQSIVDMLSDISLSLFRKNFLGMYHGSISAKIKNNAFVINTKDAIFDKINSESLCEITTNKYDYSWKIASMETKIHNAIYNNIHEAKYIACGMPPYTTAMSLDNDIISPEDYFGKMLFDTVIVHDPDDFETWYDRNTQVVPMLLKLAQSHVLVIKGIGVYVYDRDMNNLIKKVAILENSCKLLTLRTNTKLK